MLRCAAQVTAKHSVKEFPPTLSELWQSGKAAPQSICIEYYDDGVTITDITLMVDQEKTGRTVHEVRQRNLQHCDRRTIGYARTTSGTNHL
jgi:hypothetical protein